ncbi:tRNA 5-methoxyuridine(34)/uridine 5-oxyacetic acid(34) synthase CmoB [Wohlfahrtiimonas chitiniclastica]|uniref:tRNA 5-methoxyuridine(34)/uridine 5-oxyacetic acid(34) synthase CmoB n=1 Tax=Wohlfahrtiimonas chitiniclastica TaxID=400946 RepID=UPI001BCC0378|nr:tRNA 5-methoxyuridine(34)/uridine 5-oxyacetic acid(34) synthase CmoB [Wohlfahrtiimonas chitiniclastica]MBS7816090.1 tRNA 5-methoxyuridine(34)/uridine 5-oxyacetic acid(34) synthase CmoB [Wohlfahrtiimonas chitiniclastica]MBS7821915.1 tRNA 5-methoxyuridine(34)/uridine 5-oxyacetic acid(34) synthase CmoB [Wohlfahrtiimonas chitiniclastica]MBS7829707.1 tRNA 5-methoxyuridine(34)/uridine 5-oxyacetic acid(34) synthase CmoB [Wohlfahrtiimonas chitiniclastica]MBS7831674.1 tRNA 5-methoxyuridine(34)/uridin
MIDYAAIADFYRPTGLRQWTQNLSTWLPEYIQEHIHGNFDDWQAVLDQLPAIDNCTLDLVNGAILQGATDSAQLEASLRKLMPWRKGPWQFCDTHIDTEWHSDWKWARVAPHIDLHHKNVLDVGCGNGYYGMRMLGAGAKSVIGIDPNWLFLAQFKAFKHYAPDLPIWQLPIGLEAITDELAWFDTVFSMGVLYHRRSPIDHLTDLKRLLNKKGTLVLETMVIEGDEHACLIPHDRYAQMRNVWFIPSVKMLEIFLKRVGFKHVRCVDLNQTSIEEQRKTDWMTYLSLEDFLDPNDHNKTIEGYPAPLRAVIIAEQ